MTQPVTDHELEVMKDWALAQPMGQPQGMYVLRLLGEVERLRAISPTSILQGVDTTPQPPAQE